LLETNGFKMVKKDYVLYSATYLCEADDELLGKKPVYEKPDNIKEKLKMIKDAYMLFTENRFQEAVTLWPDYPSAHAQLAEMTRRQMQEQGWPWFKQHVIERAIADCPTSADVLIMATDFAMRANALNEAVDYCERALLARPENPVSLHALCNIMREMALKAKDTKERVHYFTQARDVAIHLRKVSSQHFKEATDLIFLFHAHLTFEGETGHVQSMPQDFKPQLVEDNHAQHEAAL